MLKKISMEGAGLMLTYEPGKVLIAAHRGVAGANIPCNTKAAFQIALQQGADILELDVACSKDGKLFVFHPNKEKPHLGIDTFLKDMTAAEISKLRYVNQDDTPTSYGVTPLDEMLDFLKGKAYINLDKFWKYPEAITEIIRRVGVEEQVIVKIRAKLEELDRLEVCAPDLAVIPVIKGKDTFTDMALQRNVNYIGVEVLFSSDDDDVVSDSYIQKMHDRGLLVYGNAIVYDETKVISAGHTDDRALTGDPEGGWGWFAEKKFDVIQTDWCMMLKQYLLKR